ncbi:hypothetical protein Glove_300g13 [Diversispora epigaea]|uniref:TLDc domain-containing protein n=1 Tax=Diversispora epigaea TaxID=1348612 RepID=A0A397HWL0_9GLOM|nr:hypothetical protein Glove_300g13 [Diversispora epigaea]
MNLRIILLNGELHKILHCPPLIQKKGQRNFEALKITLQHSGTFSTPELPSRGREWKILNHNQQRTCPCRRTFDRKSTTYSLSNIPEFQLILRGSRDGFRPKTFWEMCIGYAGTIALANVVGTDEIVSGYNPLAWDNSTNNIYIENKW